MVEVKRLQTVVFFEPVSEGLAVSGRQHRDGLPFFYGQGTGTDPGESTGGARPKPTSHGWKSPGRRGTITYKYVNYSIAVCKRERMANIPSPRENAMVRSTRMCRREIDESGSLWHWL